MTSTNVIDLREQVYDAPPSRSSHATMSPPRSTPCSTSRSPIPKKAVYEIDNLPTPSRNSRRHPCATSSANSSLTETLTSRDTINSKLQVILDDATNKWGVKVNRVELQDITPPKASAWPWKNRCRPNATAAPRSSTPKAKKQSLILRSEGEKASKINQAQATKESEILRAEGEARAIILNAQAEAETISRVAQAVSTSRTDPPAAYILAMKYIRDPPRNDLRTRQQDRLHPLRGIRRTLLHRLDQIHIQPAELTIHTYPNRQRSGRLSHQSLPDRFNVLIVLEAGLEPAQPQWLRDFKSSCLPFHHSSMVITAAKLTKFHESPKLSMSKQSVTPVGPVDHIVACKPVTLLRGHAAHR